MKYKVIFILMFFSCIDAQAQDNRQVFFNISYFGILGTHPGVRFGIQHPILTLNKKEATFNSHQIIGSPHVIVYFHRRNQLGVSVNYGIGYRNKQVKKTNKEIMVSLGYLRTFIPNRVYVFGEEGNPAKKSFVGTNHFIKTVSFGIGKHTGENIDSDFWMIKPTLLHIRPYNTNTTVNFAIDVGYHFK